MGRRRRLRIAVWAAGLASSCALAFFGCSENRSTSTDNTPPGLQTTDFESAEGCRSCHPDQFSDWSGSMHAYALRDPVFLEVRRIGQSMYINALDQACEQCHSPIGSRTGDIQWGPFDYDKLAKPSQDGIGCDLCHVISGIGRLNNAGILLTPGHAKFGTIKDPMATTAHLSEYSSLYSESEYCGACHDFVTSGGLELETTFREWRESGLNVTGKTCNDCHMPTYQGRAATDGSVRTVHRHTFVGADLALIDFPHRAEQRQLVTALLQDALTMNVITPASMSPDTRATMQISLTNDRTGHNVPSGVPFNRQMWLSIVVRDAQQRELYSSGQLDANGDLMDGHSVFAARDPDLFNAQATMRRADGAATGFTWDAVGLDNPSIPAGETRLLAYGFDVPHGTLGPVTVDVALRFRSFPPYVFRALGLDSLLPIPIIDMEEATRQVSVE